MNNFPTTIDSFTTHVDGDVIYAVDINLIQTAVVACETLLGITGSADNTCISYKLANISGGDRAVGASQTVTLTNKTLGTGTKVLLGSDATGDIYYNSGSGTLARLGIGSNTNVLTVVGGVLAWASPTSVAQGSYSVQGVLQGLTDAATSGLTIAAGVISVNSGIAANNIVKLNGSAQFGAIDASLLTNIPASISTNGQFAFIATTASGTQTIAHGLGKIPKKIRITAFMGHDNAGTSHAIYQSQGVYNGTTNSHARFSIISASSGGGFTGSDNTYAVYITDNASSPSNYQRATITVDGTNIYFAFTLGGTLTSDNIVILWEAQ